MKSVRYNQVEKLMYAQARLYGLAYIPIENIEEYVSDPIVSGYIFNAPIITTYDVVSGLYTIVDGKARVDQHKAAEATQVDSYVIPTSILPTIDAYKAEMAIEKNAG